MRLHKHTTNLRRCIYLLLLAGSACRGSATPEPDRATIEVSPLPSATTAAPSATPALPTVTATLAVAPRVFREEFDGDAPYWEFFPAGAAPAAFDAQPLTGSLRIRLKAANQWISGLYDTAAYGDVRLDAQVQLGADGQGAVGLICRYDPARGWYEFNIYPDQTYTLMFGQWLTEGVARYTPLVIAASEKISPSLNEIGLVCEGDVLTPYINGIQLRKREEKLHGLNQGLVGISAASFEQAPVVISYDWISVSEP